MRTIGFLPMTAHFRSMIFMLRLILFENERTALIVTGRERLRAALARPARIARSGGAPTLDVARDDAGGAFGVLTLHACDQFAVLDEDRLPARPAERDAAADGAQDLPVAPPHVGGVAIVVAVVDDAMKALGRRTL